MLDFDEALRICRELGQELALRDAEEVDLAEAAGRVLADDVTALLPVPREDYSAMDGYAVRLAEVALERPMRVSGESRPGRPLPTFEPGAAIRIFTGGAVPSGADAVIMQENARREGDQVTFTSLPRPFENVRRAGEDLKVGELALGRGARLDGAKLSLLAMLERSRVRVVRRPKVAILCTGDELRPPLDLREVTPPSEVSGLAESNSFGLRELLRHAGGAPLERVLVADEPEALQGELKGALETCDAIVTVGGASVGDHDWARPVLTGLGAQILVPKVRMKPGKPFFLANCRGVPIVGLPGNPSSAHITFALLGVPFVRALSGATESEQELLKVRLPLLTPFRQKPGRRNFLRARVGASGVEILENQASGAATSLAWANALVVVPEEVSQLAARDLVEVVLLGGLG